MRITVRHPSGRWHFPRVTLGRWELLKTVGRGGGNWRVLRHHPAGSCWDVATTPYLLLTLWRAWKNREYVPHEAWR